MENIGPVISKYGVHNHGVEGASTVYWNLPAARIYEHAARKREAVIGHAGPLIAVTGQHTGRSPNDRFLVREPSSESNIWWGKVNRSIDPAQYADLKRQLLAYYRDREIYVFDGHAGADPTHKVSVRVVTQFAWHSLFAQNMFREESDAEVLRNFEPDFTVLSAPGFHADPEASGLSSSTFIILNLAERCILIGGTSYAGEIKKSIFTVMNYRLPEQGVLPMHCSANYGTDESEVCLFFGLSGTGKTTLSADPERTLIGDDEHGWSARGVFNMEGGCYAKVIRLSPTGEPDIYATRPG
jgi:phosphoenolpyruvate carboxykinase (ATP)